MITSLRYFQMDLPTQILLLISDITFHWIKRVSNNQKNNPSVEMLCCITLLTFPPSPE